MPRACGAQHFAQGKPMATFDQPAVAPRRTRLLRSADLASYRQHLVALAQQLNPETAAQTFVLVPTAAAREQLRRTLLDRLGESSRPSWPIVGSRGDFYDHLASRLIEPPRLLSGVEREAMLAGCAREAEDAGHPAPFHVRPALVAEMLALYDHIRRVGRSVDDFDRLLTGELEAAAESDRGALQLLDQTRFLSAAFHRYESRLADLGAIDEHVLRAQISASSSPAPLRHLAIAIGDRPFDHDGFWPADVTLFTTLIGLERLDVIATEAALDAGFLERVRHAFVEIEEGQTASAEPVRALIVPDSQDHQVAFSYRDREDELEGVARRLKNDVAAGLDTAPDRTGLVVARPL